MVKIAALLRSFSPVLISVLIVVYPFFRVAIPRWPWLAPFGYLWMSSLFVGLCGIAVWALWQLVQQSRKERSWYTVSVILLWFVVIIAAAIPPEFSHDESISQVGCFISQLKGSPAAVFRSSCVWAYPSVSFAVQALPSLLFGVSLFNISLGASLLLFPGITLFAYGLRRLVRDAPEGDILAASALALLSQALVIFRLLVYHDQTSAPLALTLSFLGLLIMSIKDEQRTALFVLLPLLVFSTDMYVPVLSPLAATCAVLAWFSLRPGPPKALSLPTLIAITTIICSFLSHWYRRGDLRIGMEHHLSSGSANKAWRLLQFIILQKGGVSYAAPVLWSLLLTFLVLGSLGRWGWKGLTCALWMIATIICAYYMGGVSPDLAWSAMGGIHRAAPVFPVLIAVTLLGTAPLFAGASLRPIGRWALLLAAVVPTLCVVRKFRPPAFQPMGYAMHRGVSERLSPGEQANLSFLVRSDHETLRLLPGHYKVFNPGARSAEFKDSCVPETLPPPNTFVWTIDKPACETYALAHGYEIIMKHEARYGKFILLRVKAH